jgi:hypothetical protein
MRITLGTFSACMLAFLLTSGNLSAQQPPAAAPTADVAAVLRSHDAISAQDTASLRQWVDAHVQALAEASRGNDPKAIQAARKQLSDAPGQGATAPFRNSYAEIATAIFPPYFGTGNDPRGNDPRVSLFLIQILGSLKQPASLDALLGALGSKHSAVRYWAARSIRDMRTEIAARPGNLADRAISELAKAGAKEGYPEAAQVMYEAVDFHAQVPGSNAKMIAAWLDMLSGRLQFYSNPLMTEFYPDANALALLLSSQDLTDVQKKKAAQIAYAIVDQCVQRWGSVGRQEEGAPIAAENPYDPASVRDWHIRYQLARATQEAEALLRKFNPTAGTAAPDVAKLMADLSTADQVRTAFEKWQAIVQPAASAAATAPAAATPPAR